MRHSLFSKCAVKRKVKTVAENLEAFHGPKPSVMISWETSDDQDDRAGAALGLALDLENAATG
jgi:hypothetical protein